MITYKVFVEKLHDKLLKYRNIETYTRTKVFVNVFDKLTEQQREEVLGYMEKGNLDYIRIIITNSKYTIMPVEDFSLSMLRIKAKRVGLKGFMLMPKGILISKLKEMAK
jgi:hypothetical protein